MRCLPSLQAVVMTVMAMVMMLTSIWTVLGKTTKATCMLLVTTGTLLPSTRTT